MLDRPSDRHQTGPTCSEVVGLVMSSGYEWDQNCQDKDGSWQCPWPLFSTLAPSCFFQTALWRPTLYFFFESCGGINLGFDLRCYLFCSASWLHPDACYAIQASVWLNQVTFQHVLRNNREQQTDISHIRGCSKRTSSAWHEATRNLQI